MTTWDLTLNTDVTKPNFNMTMKSDSDYKFNGFVWKAHHMRMFGTGTYMFDTSCSTAQIEQGLADCGGTPDEFLSTSHPSRASIACCVKPIRHSGGGVPKYPVRSPSRKASRQRGRTRYGVGISPI